VTAQDRHEVTGLLPRTTNGRVPRGTRSVLIMLTMTRKAGSYDDGFADNLRLVLRSGVKHTRSGQPIGG
jgi:hypothetical protein